jgi:hypothetical protein
MIYLQIYFNAPRLDIFICSLIAFINSINVDGVEEESAFDGAGSSVKTLESWFTWRKARKSSTEDSTEDPTKSTLILT